jgi:hypothetical protein
VIGPGRPVSPMTLPSMSVTGVSSPMVPVVNTSSAVWNSARLSLLSITLLPNTSGMIWMIVRRVIPDSECSLENEEGVLFDL